ncbi:MAG: NAD(P)-dependent glycerol-3-phosphate dehydrogenase [Chloroflexi bacterium]|nr:NAD(P)-dependent glycerol-3-phosphate dehydrogenase [Chloroflexota bacterium]
MRVGVVNAGGWGTALAVKLANQGHAVSLWARRPEQAQQLLADRENRAYLPGVPIPPTVKITSDIEQALLGADAVVLAVIAGFMSDICRELRPLIGPETLLAHGTKGLAPTGYARPSEVIREALGEKIGSRVGVLAGPNHAEEVARELPAAAVIACEDPDRGARLQDLFNSSTFRVYTNTDVTGVELCSAAKNVLAIAAGVGDGLGYGDNSKAALITRGLAEMWRLVERYGGSLSTVAGLAGVGDVVATCTSGHSRNRWAGEQIGRGRRLSEVTASTPMVIEGVPAARGISKIARDVGVEMPICEGVCRVLFEELAPREALRQLLAREVGEES